MSTELVAALAALGGVTLSWLLQQLGEWGKSRKQNKREVGTLIAELFRIQRDMTFLRVGLLKRSRLTAEDLADDVWGAHELDAIQVHLFDHAGISAAFDETKKHIAETDPIAATRLDGIKAMLRKLSEVRVHEDGWPFEMAAVLIDIEQSEPELQRLLLMLARMHGPLTTWRVKRAFKELGAARDAIAAKPSVDEAEAGSR